jgi:hypothetical protein
MAWTDSKIFSQYLIDKLKNATLLDLDDAATMVALFDNSVTPDQDCTAANSAYGAGTWNSGGVSDATGWPAVGIAIGSPAVTLASAPNVIMFDGADVVSADTHATITNAYGALIYNDTIASPVADQGICYLYFGGAASVSAGTFTVAFAANGLFRITA